MPPADLSPTLHQLAFLSEMPGIDMAILFGSIAANAARRDSDVDIAVYPRKPLNHLEIQELSDHIAVATGRTVDLVDLSATDGILLRQILRTGKVLFSKNPDLLGILWTRLLAWQEDFEPTLNKLMAARLQRFLEPCHEP